MNHDDIPMNQLAALYTGLIESINEGIDVDDIANRVVDSIDIDALTERAVENIDLENLTESVLYQIDFVDLANRVYENVDIDEVSRDVMESLDYSQIADMTHDILDWDKVADNLDIEGRVRDYVDDTVDVGSHVESLLASFSYNSPCSVGRYFISAWKEIYEDVSAELVNRVKAMEDLVNEMRQTANPTAPEPVSVEETYTGPDADIDFDSQVVESDEETHGIFNPELMGIINLSQYILNNIENPNVKNFEPLTLWSHYLNAKTSYIDSLKENREK